MRKLRAVGSHVFAGGFTLGVREHFDVVAHLESNDYGVATMRHNQPDVPVYTDPDSWPINDILDRKLEGERPDLVYGNPPCAAWSAAGYSKTRGTDKWRNDPRVELTRRHFSLLEKMRPRVWVWESVTQAYHKGAEFVADLEAQARELGYDVTYYLHDAKWFGVPQTRKRFFMICHDVDLSLPAPNWQPPTTVGEVLSEVTPRGDRISLSGMIGDWVDKHIQDIPPGTRLRKYWEKLNPPETRVLNPNGTVKGRPSFGHIRAPKDDVSGAIVGYAVIHPTEDRFLYANEMAALCGYPEWYNFASAGKFAQASEIARGVCPPVARHLAAKIKAAVERADEPRGRTVEVDHRRPPKGSESLERELPRDYDPVEQEGQRDVEEAAQQATHVPARVRLPRPKPGARVGDYIKLLIMMNEQLQLTDAEIAVAARKHYPKSKSLPRDVSNNRGYLRKDGYNPPKAIRRKEAA